MSHGRFPDIHSLVIDIHPSRIESHVAAGLKAAIHNPNVFEEAKERAADRLDSMGADTETQYSSRSGQQESSHVLGGYKATLNSESYALYYNSYLIICANDVLV